MTNLDPINVNSPLVSGNSSFLPNPQKQEAKPEEEQVTQINTVDLPADKVLDFMSNYANQYNVNVNKPSNTITHLDKASNEEIQAYLDAHFTKEQQANIASSFMAFINEFEPYVIENLRRQGM